MITVASFASLEIIAVVAFAIPLLMDVLHIRMLPLVVVEIVAGIVIGPYGLHWVTSDAAVQIFSSIGLAFLLFLAGIEVNIRKLRGPILKLAGSAYLLTIVLSFLAAIMLGALRLVIDAPFIAVILTASALGVVLPPLKATGLTTSRFGQVVIMGASLGEFGAILLLSALFSSVSLSQPSRLLLLAGFVVAAVIVYTIVLHADQSKSITALLVRLQDSTAQVRIRGAWVFLAAFVVLAQALGQTAILGAFIAGMLIRVLDPDETTRHPEFRRNLDAVGYGVFIPVFFIATGVEFDLPALLTSTRALTLVPVILLLLLVAHGLPALLYRRILSQRQTIAAGLFQATSLTFILAATQIGLAQGFIRPSTSAALIAAGMLSILIFPLVALTIVNRERSATLTAEGMPNEEASTGGQPQAPHAAAT
ncbi:MAG: hypothetical protein OJF49_003570 [Ktedonobacterales bacterium]|jgi:Kef-type K+ transport system membrane component KefB|nr:MAG: hypothetical protein OJF49_003570 [Ktedonobacterales bacterium]